MPIERYRPSLTAEQITTIIRVFKQIPQDTTVQDVLATLVPFEAKIIHGIKQPVSSVETLTEKLGWETGMSLTPAEKREAAWNKWVRNPQDCTLIELELASDYRYQFNLMSDEERKKHEEQFN